MRARVALIPLLALLSIVLPAACGDSSYSDHYVSTPYPLEDFEETVRTDSVEVVTSIREHLGLDARFVVAWFVTYTDGGSIGGVLLNADCDSLTFAIDRRMRTDGEAGEDAPHHAYLGAQYFTEPNSRRLLVGSDEERALILALLWYSRCYPEETLRGAQGQPSYMFRALHARSIARNLAAQRNARARTSKWFGR